MFPTAGRLASGASCSGTEQQQQQAGSPMTDSHTACTVAVQVNGAEPRTPGCVCYFCSYICTGVCTLRFTAL